jgi:hypothetical protein
VHAVVGEWRIELDRIAQHVIGKQRDYGHGNILAFGLFGLVVRVSDKEARLQNLLGSKHEAVNEPIADTWVDLVGYSLVALMLSRGWFELPLREDVSQLQLDLRT